MENTWKTQLTELVTRTKALVRWDQWPAQLGRAVALNRTAVEIVSDLAMFVLVGVGFFIYGNTVENAQSATYAILMIAGFAVGVNIFFTQWLKKHRGTTNANHLKQDDLSSFMKIVVVYDDFIKTNVNYMAIAAITMLVGSWYGNLESAISATVFALVVLGVMWGVNATLQRMQDMRLIKSIISRHPKSNFKRTPATEDDGSDELQVPKDAGNDSDDTSVVQIKQQG
jgi:F0F1-type ATP synthase assembly protein I